MIVFSRVYGLFEIGSALLHIIVHLKIFLHKRKRDDDVIAAKFDAKSLFSFGINLILISTLMATTILGPKLNPEKLKHLSIYPNYLTLYYNGLIAPGIIGTISVFLIFYRNDRLRKGVFKEMLMSIGTAESLYTYCKRLLPHL